MPIHQIATDLVQVVRDDGAVVLSAPTGSGKTTQVPQMLLPVVEGLILVLQPRRLAARLVARRIAAERGESVGDVVGFQTRHERQSGPDTRILFVTEGLFLRRLLSEPDLPGVGAVVLDEFHERSIDADLALGLVRRLRAQTRPDLRLVVMSATLDAARLADTLDCPALHAEGRAYDVAVDYVDGGDAPVWDQAASALRGWLDAGGSGDVLIFLPGAYEIRRTVDACRARLRADDGATVVLPLHGQLPAAEQDRAVRAAPERRVIVSTNVAETSITIDGITCVIDAGLARIARYDPGRAVNTLLIERISLASAEQRRGRAGRTAPGTCLRLWPRSEAHARPAHDVPEVLRVDLAQARLQMAALEIGEPFDWIDPPPEQRWQQAGNLLRDLGATDDDGQLTPDGLRMAQLPAHPRLARLLLEGARQGVTARACLWAALLAERDIAQRPLAPVFRTASDDDVPSDLLVRERAFEQARKARFDTKRCAQLSLSVGACRDVDRAAKQLQRSVDRIPSGQKQGSADVALARCVLAAFAGHVGLRRRIDDRTCEMEGRRRVVLHHDTVIGDSPLFVAVDVRELEAPRSEGGGLHTVASLATAIQPEWIETLFPQRVTRDSDLQWDDEQQAVVELASLRFGQLALAPVTRPPRDRAAAAQILAQRIVEGRLRLDGWNEAVETWLARCRCVAGWFPERGLLAYDDDDLAVIVSEVVGDAVRFGGVRRANVYDPLRQAMSWADQQFVEEMAPERLRLPSGHGMRIRYTPGEPPRGQARIQDLYGLTETPRVGGGRIPLLLEILAPNFRPAQVTDDLAGFWERTYPELRKELKRRYPKHEWR